MQVGAPTPILLPHRPASPRQRGGLSTLNIPQALTQFLPIGLALTLCGGVVRRKEACCDLSPHPQSCPGAPRPSQLCSLPGQLV